MLGHKLKTKKECKNVLEKCHTESTNWLRNVNAKAALTDLISRRSSTWHNLALPIFFFKDYLKTLKCNRNFTYKQTNKKFWPPKSKCGVIVFFFLCIYTYFILLSSSLLKSINNAVCCWTISNGQKLLNIFI